MEKSSYTLMDKINFKIYKIWSSIIIKIFNAIELFCKKFKTENNDDILNKIKSYKLKYKLERILKTQEVLSKQEKEISRLTNKQTIKESDENDLNFEFEFKFSAPEILKMIIDGIKIISQFGSMVKSLPPGEEKDEARKFYKDSIFELRKILPQFKIPGIQRVIKMLPSPDITLKEEIIELSSII
ncbi:MAG: hypothetical protein LBF97_08145 [Elusimicrobiota bacterium]|jgi:hypothetical protein|nr:hypothetical protein [Elusimicrobiota bacterium]